MNNHPFIFIDSYGRVQTLQFYLTLNEDRKIDRWELKFCPKLDRQIIDVLGDASFKEILRHAEFQHLGIASISIFFFLVLFFFTNRLLVFCTSSILFRGTSLLRG